MVILIKTEFWIYHMYPEKSKTNSYIEEEKTVIAVLKVFYRKWIFSLAIE